MRKNILAICDSETTYCSRISMYLSTHGFHQYTIMTFSGMDKLEAFLDREQTTIDILLLAESSYEESEALKQVKKTILLQDEGILLIENLPVINKYQSIPNLMQQVSELCAQDRNCEGYAFSGAKAAKIYGFYMPGEDDVVHMSALAFAQIMAEQKKVLYLNLSTYASMEQWFGASKEEETYDLGDLIYYLKQNEEKALYKIAAIKHTSQGMDYILPIAYPSDLREISGEDWTRLLKCLCYRSEYEILVLDFGDSVSGLYDLLNECDELIMPVYANPFVRERIKIFTRMCREKLMEYLIEKTRQVELEGNVQNFGNSLMDIKQSSLGYKMREMVRGYDGNI